MNLESAILLVIYLQGALTFATLMTSIGMVAMYRKQRDMDTILREIAGKPRTHPNAKSSISALTILLLVTGVGVASSPREAVAAAHRDIKAVPRPLREFQRYLTDYHYTHNPKEQDVRGKLGDFWFNSLSRESDPVKMARVPYRDDTGKPLLNPDGKPRLVPGLYRINILDYKLPLKVWEKLAFTDPYLHTPVEKAVKRADKPVEYEEKVVEWEGGIWPYDGKEYAKGSFKYKKKVPVAAKEEVVEEKPGRSSTDPSVGQAVGVDPKQILDLVLECNTQAPILRLDWFMVETSQQTERQGTGYYDFLEIKKRADWDKQAFLRKDDVEEAQKRVMAIVPYSGVAINGRQILRAQTITGGVWITLDTIKQVKREDNDKRDVVQNLDKDLVHDAEEGYAFNKAGFFIFWKGDAKGNRQDSVPDNVASDKVSPGNEARIHPYSCIMCHEEGIRPIDDYARRLYKQRLSMDNPDIGLTGPKYEKQKELQRLYLRDLEGHIKEDQARYARTLMALTAVPERGIAGFTPQQLAKEWTKLQKGYRDTNIGLEEAAREYGTTPSHLKNSLGKAAEYYQRQGFYLNTNFVGLLQSPQLKMRRDTFERLYIYGMMYVHGQYPPIKPPTGKPP